jgi:hypothetical protein
VKGVGLVEQSKNITGPFEKILGGIFKWLKLWIL